MSGVSKDIAKAMAKRGTIVPKRSPNQFGPVARLLWPRKTAAELAYRAHVTERAAKYWLSGQREPPAAVIMAVVNKMLTGR